MKAGNILLLIAMTLLPVVVSSGFYMLKRMTRFSELPEYLKQIIIGVGFGLVAILGTQLGVNMDGVVINARDAAPLCAGIFFGARAGIISSVIGGLYRYIAVLWGAGTYSQLACSISTALAGIIAGLMRKFLFEEKRPDWLFCFCIGAVMEILHLSLLFLTHMESMTQVYRVIRHCLVPMVVCNGAAVMLTCAAIDLHSKSIHRFVFRRRAISQLVQLPLLTVVVLGVVISSVLIYNIQTRSSVQEATSMMRINLDDVREDINGECDKEMETIALQMAKELEANPDADLADLAGHYEIDDIYVVNEEGIVVRALNGEPGYDMTSDADLPVTEQQSNAFMVLLDGQTKVFVQAVMPLATDHSQYVKFAGAALEDGGFVQIGYDLATYHSHIREHVRTLASNRSVGKEGYILIVDPQGNVVSDDETIDGEPLDAYNQLDYSIVDKDILMNAEVNGEPAFVYATETEGFTLLAVLTEDEVFSSRDHMMIVYVFLEILVFALVSIVTYLIISRMIVNKIHKINGTLAEIREGNLDSVVKAGGSEEFTTLSAGINDTVGALKHYIGAAEERMASELSLAQQIQHSALPSVFPAFPQRTEMDVRAAMYTARQVGGDFYDFYFTGKRKFAFLIADVSGKGIPAALFMMKAKSIIKSLAESQLPVDEVFNRANNALCEGNDADMFVTAWMGIVDFSTGRVTYVNAGHNPPVLMRKGQPPEYLRSKPGFVLAGMPGMRYTAQAFSMNPGDRILLYTDGVTEATTRQETLYGEERLLSFLAENGSMSDETLLDGLKMDIDAFVGDAEQFDDISMLLFDFKRRDAKQKLEERLFPARLDRLEEAQAFVAAGMEKAGVPEKTAMQISVAFEEMFVNVCNYAYPDAEGDVTVGMAATDGDVTIRLTDAGIPFNPLEKETPDTTLSAEERPIGGLGIFMVRKTMDEVEYAYQDRQNVFTMRKHYE